MGELDTDQLIAVVDKRGRWHESASVGNCSDGRKHQKTIHFSGADAAVSSSWRMNLSKRDDDVESQGGCAEDIVDTGTEQVVDNHQQVAHALHWASTCILGLLVVEVRRYLLIYLLTYLYISFL